MLTDTHAHLYWDSYEDDLDEVIQRSIDAGITSIINVGVDVKKSEIAAKQVKEKLSKISALKSYSTIGIHPHESLNYHSDVSIHQDVARLEKLYQTQPNQIVAIGECGLDYFFDPQFIPPTLPPSQIKDSQKKLFKAQIDLAKKLNLPLIVHCRDDRSKDPTNSEAWDEVLELVGDHPTILHCYSGLPETTNHILKTSNLLVSFAATLTYPKNEYLREAAKVIPLEKICLETDCPFLPPQSKRGQRNEPSTVLEIAHLISDIKNVSLEKVAQSTSLNVKNMLKLDT